MTTLRAHFDGRVLVPDEPVNLPQNTVLELQVREIPEDQSDNFPRAVMGTDPNTGLPVINVPRGTKIVTSEDVARALDEP